MNFISNIMAVDFSPITKPVLEIVNAILWPLIAVIGSVGTIYCIILGAKYARAEDQNGREKAKKDLIGAVVGFLLIFVLIVSLKIAIPILQRWVATQIM